MSEYMRILKMIENGEISPEEGAQLLQRVGSETSETSEHAIDTKEILARIERGELSTDEGIQLIGMGGGQNVDSSSGKDSKEENFEPSTPRISDEELERWKRWWTIPLYVGVGIVILSTFWMNSAYQNSQFGFWFFCSWIPLLIGLLIITLAWGSRSGPWIHVRVRGPKERVAISLPAPMGITGWALRNFGHYIPHLEKTSIDEILLALENTSKQKTPLYVQVDEGDSGEHVEVFIG